MAKVIVLTDSDGKVRAVVKNEKEANNWIPYLRWERRMDGATNTTIYVNTVEMKPKPSGKGYESYKKRMEQMKQNESLNKTNNRMLKLNEHLNNVKIIEEAVDLHAATELELFIMNDSTVYSQKIEPILKNLSKKFEKGQYDTKKAVKAWMYAVDLGAKKYAADFGSGSNEGFKMFDKKTREHVAAELEKQHRNEIENGDYA